MVSEGPYLADNGGGHNGDTELAKEVGDVHLGVCRQEHKRGREGHLRPGVRCRGFEAVAQSGQVSAPWVSAHTRTHLPLTSDDTHEHAP